ncbi:MAG: hypothetical protein AAF600_13215 [Bacteroidota bacterium]
MIHFLLFAACQSYLLSVYFNIVILLLPVYHVNMLTTPATTEDTITIPRAEYEELKRQLAGFQRFNFWS